MSIQTEAGQDGVIDVRDISFTYPGGRTVLNHISFWARAGRTVTILGPNGAGKTTLLSCLCNLLRPDSGEIRLNGFSLCSMTPRGIAKAVGYVPQQLEPSFAYTVMEYVVTGCAPSMDTFERPSEQHYASAKAAIRQLGIEHLAERSYMHISGGERQLVALARVLTQKSGFILLDEPVAHLDCGNQIRVLKLVRQLAEMGYGVLMTTHNPDHALLLGGDAAVIGRDGRLRFGPGEEILRQPVLSELYETDLRVVHVDALSRSVCASPKI